MRFTEEDLQPTVRQETQAIRPALLMPQSMQDSTHKADQLASHKPLVPCMEILVREFQSIYRSVSSVLTKVYLICFRRNKEMIRCGKGATASSFSVATSENLKLAPRTDNYHKIPHQNIF